jgi:hypothetical protein
VQLGVREAALLVRLRRDPHQRVLAAPRRRGAGRARCARGWSRRPRTRSGTGASALQHLGEGLVPLDERRLLAPEALGIRRSARGNRDKSSCGSAVIRASRRELHDAPPLLDVGDRNVRNSSGRPATHRAVGLEPRAHLGQARARPAAALRRPTDGGAASPDRAARNRPRSRSPEHAARSAATSGSAGTRARSSRPAPCTRPDFTCGSALSSGANMSFTWPPTTSDSAGALPGTGR